MYMHGHIQKQREREREVRVVVLVFLFFGRPTAFRSPAALLRSSRPGPRRAGLCGGFGARGPSKRRSSECL